MKKYFMLLVLVLCWLYSLCAEASEGNIEIDIAAEQELEFTCKKVADYVNGEMRLSDMRRRNSLDLMRIENAKELNEIISILQTYETNEIIYKTSENGKIVFGNLEPGAYLVECISEEEYDVSPSLIRIFEGETVEMIPKMERRVMPVQTGDEGMTGMLILFAGSLAVILKLMLRKKFTNPFIV